MSRSLSPQIVLLDETLGQKRQIHTKIFINPSNDNSLPFPGRRGSDITNLLPDDWLVSSRDCIIPSDHCWFFIMTSQSFNRGNSQICLRRESPCIVYICTTITIPPMGHYTVSVVATGENLFHKTGNSIHSVVQCLYCKLYKKQSSTLFVTTSNNSFHCFFSRHYCLQSSNPGLSKALNHTVKSFTTAQYSIHILTLSQFSIHTVDDQIHYLKPCPLGGFPHTIVFQGCH